MASTQPSLDTVITVKVAYDGTTRRAKMALRDTAPRVLEEQIRAFLHIPADADIILERYSDSAASYIELHHTNTAVYKQLYRAAKAKSKLKLRVTLKQQEDAAVPKPVTIEDADENTASNSTQALPTKKTTAASQSINSHIASMPRLHSPAISKTYESSFLTEAAKIAESSDLRREFQARIAGLGANLDRQSKQQTPSQLQEPAEEKIASPLPECPRFAICCNSCEKTTPDVHYHCSTCDDGDFDLCQACVEKGISCYGTDHWLIKRTKVDGQIVTSVTETIAPKMKLKAEPKKQDSLPNLPSFDAAAALAHLQENLAKLELTTAARIGDVSMRTCNSCIQELPETEFLHCENCEDFDLCRDCFSKDAHGHHPKHVFSPAVAGSVMAEHINVKLAAGRNQIHHAICDGCDKFITGVRHKCLDCPDWDYCVDCIPKSAVTHPTHRFVPIYEPLKANFHTDCPASQPSHIGICCDGPLCSSGKGYPAYIQGVRYKCAVCHDVDFCASCEANPMNKHNKSHPLIKFNTPVRHVSVTTQGENPDGQPMPVMGDRPVARPTTRQSASSLSTPKTVVDTKPQAPVAKQVAEPEVKEEKAPVKEEDSTELRAMFIDDSIRDGTIMPANQVFEQTWTLRNEGKTAWPAGCSVKFVGGDYMGHIDSSRPARTAELVEASESNSCHAAVAPGQAYSFTVKLRTPPRPGKVVSYWRPTTPEGHKFGDRLWCEVNVRMITASTPVAKPAPEPKQEKESEPEPEIKSSQMIFPKLEKESPVASFHEDAKSGSSQAETQTPTGDDFEDFGKPDEWDGSDDEDSFLTDEEYDILDASDEEFLEEQQKKLSK